MGLLGDGFDDPQSQMIMGLAQGLLSARGGAGLAAGLGNMQQIQQNKGKNRLIEAQLRKFESEIADQQLQAQERQAQARQAQSIRDGLPGLFSQPTSPGAFSPSIDGMGPTMPQSMQGQQGGQFDMLGGIRLGMPFPMIKEAMALTAGPEYAPEVRYDQNGKAFMTAKNGTVKYLDGVSARDKLVETDLGGSKGFRTEYSPNLMGSLAKTVTPDAQYQGGITLRGQNMTDSRARETMAFNQGNATADAGGPSQAAFTKQFGKAEPGFRWKQDGTSEPIPGGSKDIKAGEIGDKREKGAQHAIGQANVVIKSIDDAIGKAGFFETGLTGATIGKVAGTDAYDLRRKVETVQANIGFDALQKMRDMSPTGGALGQVAVQELAMLQATLGNLQANQSRPELIKNLNSVKTHYGNWKKVMEQVSGGSPAAPKPPGQASIPADAINRLKMDPKLKPFFDQKYGAGASDQYLGR